MEIAKNKVVEITYQLRLDGFDGEIIEEVKKNKPFVFLFGSGIMLESFEEQLKGLKKGDDFHFTLGYNEAYGEVIPENVVSLPKKIFEIDGKFNDEMVYVGAIVPMKDEKGNEYDGLIAEIQKTQVKVDFNHPLAGEDLFFDGKILNVRTATKEEISHGHVHGHGGHDH
jgi:FKBP-type peptidyl-prolyl cis-trans isomerase SlyD